MEPLQQQMPKRRAMAEINVVPYIDVMLVLLIIFMVTAPMLVQTVPVNLPNVDSTPTEIDPDDTTLMLSVNSDGLYFVERDEEDPKPMSLREVTEYAGKLFKAEPKSRFMIRGDESVPYGKVVLLMGSLQGAGITNVGLVTEAPDPEARP
ncbi:MAG: protein TolR [Alcanivorax sp.]|jgi:biopolymer transport protein TolR|nr:MAG: protein TolR [Oceanobacter sp.]|tara:strand:+ start:4537 stop:4986 length:450 start_codon:yes stop_codon:yes gene_type:complete